MLNALKLAKGALGSNLQRQLPGISSDLITSAKQGARHFTHLAVATKNEPEKYVPIEHYLERAVVPLILAGGIPAQTDRPRATAKQVEDLYYFLDEIIRPELTSFSKEVTPFQELLRTNITMNDYNTYMNQKMDQLENNGGVLMTSVIRDLCQEGKCSLSGLLQAWFGYISMALPQSQYLNIENGGAKNETAILLGISDNTITTQEAADAGQRFMQIGLKRSFYNKSLKEKTPGELNWTTADESKFIKQTMGVPDASFVPQERNMFDARNFLDRVMGASRIAFENGFFVYPNLVVSNTGQNLSTSPEARDTFYDNSFGFQLEAGYDILRQRIKIPGDISALVTADMFVDYFIQPAADKANALGKPFLASLHSHNNGLADAWALAGVKECQKRGIRINIDTNPPGTTHIRNDLFGNPSSEESERIALFNEGTRRILDLLGPWDMGANQSPPVTSKSAGGTKSSDQKYLSTLGVHLNTDQLEKQKDTVRCLEYRNEVTPVAHHITVLATAAYQKGLTTDSEFIEYINNGGTIDVPADILQEIADWKTEEIMPDLTRKFLENHGYEQTDLSTVKEEVGVTYDEARRALEKKYPTLTISDSDVAASVSYNPAYNGYMEQKSKGQHLDPLINSPELFLAADTVKSFTLDLNGRMHDVKITGKFESVDKKTLLFRFKVDGVDEYSIEVPNPDMPVGSEATSHPKVSKDSETQIGVPMAGKIKEISVKVGDVVEKDDPLFTLEAMKMENIVKAPRKLKILKIYTQESDPEINDLIFDVAPMDEQDSSTEQSQEDATD